MMLKTTKNQYSYLIDVLRFLAAIWVVLFHFNQPIAHINNWYRNFCKYGYLGVPAFFLISGYCICIAANHSKTPKDFMIRRLFRILPPYWFSLVVVLACVIIQKITTGTNSITVLPKTVEGILCVVFLCTSPLTKYGNINWVYWTLSYELFFYFLIFLALYLNEKMRVIALIVILLAIIIMPNQGTGILFFTSQLPVFLLGFSIFNVLKKNNYIGLYGLLLIVSIAAMFTTHQSVAWCLVCLIVVLLILLDNCYPFKKSLLSKYGDVSYSVYLIHVPIGVGLLGFIKSASIQTNIYFNIIEDLAMLMFIVFLAHYMHRYIEKPSIYWGKQFINNPTDNNKP